MASHTTGLFLFCVSAAFSYVSTSPQVCSNSLIPGAKGFKNRTFTQTPQHLVFKWRHDVRNGPLLIVGDQIKCYTILNGHSANLKGDQGEIGYEGDEGRMGKNGPPGHPGALGEVGSKGDVGHIGKMGPIGAQGDKGNAGLDGPLGLKGKAGTTCDCGRYRKVIGQMDVNLGKLRNTIKFVKNIMLSLTESDEHYYLLVKEAKRFKEASMNCELRGGILAMPNNIDSNRLIADYVSQSGLTRVYIGVQAKNTDMLTHEGRNSSRDADSKPLKDFPAWSQDEELTSSSHNASCVELLSTGTWSHVECDMAMFFICEFPKSRIRG